MVQEFPTVSLDFTTFLFTYWPSVEVGQNLFWERQLLLFTWFVWEFTRAQSVAPSFFCHINDLPKAVKSQVYIYHYMPLCWRLSPLQENWLATRSRNSPVRPKWARVMGRYTGRALHYQFFLIFSVPTTSPHTTTLNNHILQQVDCSPYLGFTLTHDLRWTTPINITRKTSSTLGFLGRNLQFCPPSCRKTAYSPLSALL